MQGHIAVLSIILIKQTQLLRSMGIAIGIIAIQYDQLWWLIIRSNELIDKCKGNVVKLPGRHGVFKPAHGGL